MPFFVPPHWRPFVGPLALPLSLQKLNPCLSAVVGPCMLPLLGPAGSHVAHLATTLLPCLAVHVALLVQPHIPLVTLHPIHAWAI